MPETNPDPKPNFKEVTTVPNINGGAQRLSMLGTIETSGRTSFTMTPSEALDQLATDEGIPLNEYMTTFGADADASLISVSVARIGTDSSPSATPSGSSPCTWAASSRSTRSSVPSAAGSALSPPGSTPKGSPAW